MGVVWAITATLATISCATASPNELWYWQVGTEATEWIFATALDSAGDLFVGGYTEGIFNVTTSVHDDDGVVDEDFVAVKINGTTGETLWQWQDGTIEADIGQAAAVDSTGNFFLAGDTYDDWDGINAGKMDFAAVKLNGQTGKEIWRWQDGTLWYDSIWGAGIDPEDDLLLGGHSSSSFSGTSKGDFDFVSIKLNGETGLEMWRWQNGTEDEDWINDAAVDQEGNIFLTGYTYGSLGGVNNVGKSDFVAMKLDGALGIELWNWQAGTVWEDNILSCAIDPYGDVILGGHTTGVYSTLHAGDLYDLVAIKINGVMGNEIWRWQHGTLTIDSVFTVDVDPAGNVLLGGDTFGDFGGSNVGSYDFLAVKLDGKTGEEIGRWQGGTPMNDTIRAGVVNSAGDYLMSGYTEGSYGGKNSGSWDIMAVKLETSRLGLDPTPAPVIITTAPGAATPSEGLVVTSSPRTEPAWPTTMPAQTLGSKGSSSFELDAVTKGVVVAACLAFLCTLVGWIMWQRDRNRSHESNKIEGNTSEETVSSPKTKGNGTLQQGNMDSEEGQWTSTNPATNPRTPNAVAVSEDIYRLDDNPIVKDVVNPMVVTVQDRQATAAMVVEEGRRDTERTRMQIVRLASNGPGIALSAPQCTPLPHQKLRPSSLKSKTSGSARPNPPCPKGILKSDSSTGLPPLSRSVTDPDKFDSQYDSKFDEHTSSKERPKSLRNTPFETAGAVAAAAVTVAAHSNIPGVAEAATLVSVLVGLVSDYRGNEESTQDTYRWCRSIVGMLDCAQGFLAKNDCPHALALLDDVRFSIASLVSTGLALSMTSQLGNMSSQQNNMVAKQRRSSRVERRQLMMSQHEIPAKQVKFFKGEDLGTGGFGKVHMVDYLGATSAAKVMDFRAIPAQSKIGKRLRNMFARELQTMLALRSPYTVQVYGAVTSLQDQLILVMEFVDGGDLRNLLGNRAAVQALSDNTALNIVADVAAGVSFLHSMKVTHGDIKSPNVLLTANRLRAKISDFGTARMAGEVTTLMSSTKTSTVTFRWCAPEVLDDELPCPASDVYSFGVVAWEVMARQLPWEDVKRKSQVISTILKGKRLELPERMPGPLCEVVEACWAHKPRNRPSADVVSDSLEAMRPRVE